MIGISQDSYNYKPITLEVQKSKAKSERADIISKLVDGVNTERPCTYILNGKKKTLGKITGRAVAIKMSHIPTKDLYYILSICTDAKNRGQSFSKVMFGSIKA